MENMVLEENRNLNKFCIGKLERWCSKSTLIGKCACAEVVDRKHDGIGEESGHGLVQECHVS